MEAENEPSSLSDRCPFQQCQLEDILILSAENLTEIGSEVSAISQGKSKVGCAFLGRHICLAKYGMYYHVGKR